jgi:hypothetical protein
MKLMRMVRSPANRVTRIVLGINAHVADVVGAVVEQM